MDGQKPEELGNGQAVSQPSPGETIQPGQQQQPVVSDATPSPIQPAVAGQPVDLAAVEEQQAAAGFFRASEGVGQAPSIGASEFEEPNFDPQDVVEWTASEFVAHHKTNGWYLVLTSLAVSVAILVWFLTKDIVSPVVVILAGIILGSYANRKPRQLQYRADPGGLTIGERYYSFNEFKGFTIVHDGAFSSLVFYPMQRFGFIITAYYDPQDEERIFGLVSQRVPYEQDKHDPIDNLMRRIRF